MNAFSATTGAPERPETFCVFSPAVAAQGPVFTAGGSRRSTAFRLGGRRRMLDAVASTNRPCATKESLSRGMYVRAMVSVLAGSTRWGHFMARHWRIGSRLEVERLSRCFRWVAVAAIVVAESGSAVAQSSGAASATAAPTDPLGFERRPRLSPQEVMKQAATLLARMNQGAATVRRQLDAAREQRDVVKSLCLSDKLSQIDVATRTAKDRQTALQAAVQRNDVALSNHEFTMLTVLRQRTEQLIAEANQCIGEDVSFHWPDRGDGRISDTSGRRYDGVSPAPRPADRRRKSAAVADADRVSRNVTDRGGCRSGHRTRSPPKTAQSTSWTPVPVVIASDPGQRAAERATGRRRKGFRRERRRPRWN